MRLSVGGAELVLRPELGGAIGALTYEGLNILRSGAEAMSVLETAAFPLMPFSGRIENAEFLWYGTRVKLNAFQHTKPHALHGQAWLSHWSIDQVSANTAILNYEHAPSDWPWRYRATQSFELSANKLNVNFDLRNLSDSSMPAGIGWHPYFNKPCAELCAPVSQIWEPEGLSFSPDTLGQSNDLNSAKLAADLELDHPFTRLSEPVTISNPKTGITVSMKTCSTLNKLIVYTPKEDPFFCVEPVSHIPNAHNSPVPFGAHGLKSLKPLERMVASIELSWRAH